MGSMGSIRTQGPPNIYNTTAAIYYAVSGHWSVEVEEKLCSGGELSFGYFNVPVTKDVTLCWAPGG